MEKEKLIELLNDEGVFLEFPYLERKITSLPTPNKEGAASEKDYYEIIKSKTDSRMRKAVKCYKLATQQLIEKEAEIAELKDVIEQYQESVDDKVSQLAQLKATKAEMPSVKGKFVFDAIITKTGKKVWQYCYDDENGLNQHSKHYDTKEEAEEELKIFNNKSLPQSDG